MLASFLVKVILIVTTYSYVRVVLSHESKTINHTEGSEGVDQEKSAGSKDLLKKVELSLLRAFGMTSKPQPRKNVDIPSFMIELFKEQENVQEFYDVHSINKVGAKTANIVRSYTHRETALDSSYPEGRFRFRFDISVPKDEAITAALLRLHVNSTPHQTPAKQSHKQTVKVFDVLKPSTRSDPDAIMRLVDVRVVKAKDSGWIEMDVLPAVARWIEQPRKNYGLYVKVTSSNKNKHRVRLRRSTSSPAERSFDPLLVTFTEEKKVSTRTKRAPRRRHRQKKHRREACRRHEFYVDFQEVGWNDWIITPPGFNAYYCEGECNFPLADHLNTTNHAIVQTIVNNINPNLVPRACCIPTQLAPISMLYVDEYDRAVLKNYQEMVVEGCGCR